MAISACAVLAWPAIAGAVAPKTITVAAAAPQAGNCWPFGEASNPNPIEDWRPYFGFVYKNIPGFQLKAGDTFAFDLGEPNDFDVQVDIAMAWAANGTDANTSRFVQVVRNTQTPASPRGDATAGNYELRFTAESPFRFPGGGLIIRVSNPGPSFIGDTTCPFGNHQLVGAVDQSDPSNLFVERVYSDIDGVAPWDHASAGPIGQFQLTLLPASNDFRIGKLKRNVRNGTAKLPVRVPGAGKLTLGGKGVAGQSTSVKAPGAVGLRIRAKGGKRTQLFERGEVGLKLRVTFAPDGDPAEGPRTVKRRVTLIAG